MEHEMVQHEVDEQDVVEQQAKGEATIPNSALLNDKSK